jgi:hypothetical protein
MITMHHMLQNTRLAGGHLVWSPEEAEAFELLTGSAPPATVAEALTLLRAVQPAPGRAGSPVLAVLDAADAQARAAFIRDLEMLQAAGQKLSA